MTKHEQDKPYFQTTNYCVWANIFE